MQSLTTLFQQFEIVKTNDKNPCDALINEFRKEINQERESNGWRYKKGEKWVKVKPVTFMAVKMKLLAIKGNQDLLEYFLSECKDYKNRTGSFSKRFFGGLKI